MSNLDFKVTIFFNVKYREMVQDRAVQLYLRAELLTIADY